ncbi:MAG: HAD-IA family hydrolase [Syntrophorhabdaceae bacterium]|nr:HAD-IA family hydrolase [Syntrophorhabdales bacterium]MBP9560347.1 HAD-IA family hydrolase [Syntrophorhabdaceae bacterium]
MTTTGWRIDCVIYDCDGVLFDSLEANRRLYNFIASSMGRGALTEEELKYCHTHTVFESLKYMFRDPDMEKKAVDFLKNHVQLADYIVYLKMEPNLLTALDMLKSRGIIRTISTNRTTSMKHVMERYNLWQYFDMVVTALDVTNPKPHPESVEKIIGSFNIKREHVLFVGDSEVDRQTAVSSGVKFISYKNSELACDGFIDDHLSLMDFLSDGYIRHA